MNVTCCEIFRELDASMPLTCSTLKELLFCTTGLDKDVITKIPASFIVASVDDDGNVICFANSASFNVFKEMVDELCVSDDRAYGQEVQFPDCNYSAPCSLEHMLTCALCQALNNGFVGTHSAVYLLFCRTMSATAQSKASKCS